MKNKAYIWAGIILVVLIGLVMFSGEDAGPGAHDEFAQCINDAGLVMYGTEWCLHCKDQKAMFGNSFRLVNYVDCDLSRSVCLAEGVNGYPTWKHNGQSYPGTQSLETLASISGCELTYE
jgi:hypothetical protein|tara:strand:- start:19345 stop:19704 length:360 start_codon:yes stop_codon:yes gene_type:complete